jgi:galactose mutarotase-like enzyme
MAAEAVTRIEKERILIEVGACAVTILPQFGGKVASIRVKEHELLQAPLVPYAPRTRTMSFDEGDASGWDECLPSVANCTVKTVNGPVHVPDHGDIWRVEWKVLSSANGSLTMLAEGFSLPLALKRTITVAQTEMGYRLHAGYQVTNTGATVTPWAWSAHPCYASETGDVVTLPGSIKTLRLEGSGGGRLGKGGVSVAWPMAKLVTGGETNLSIATPPETGTGDKLFAGPLAATENWVALERPKAGVRLRVSFDPAATPYLGLWLCNGGWPDRPGTKQHCVAMEPTTAPVDSLGIEGSWSRSLAVGESFRWPMTLDLELL